MNFLLMLIATTPASCLYVVLMHWDPFKRNWSLYNNFDKFEIIWWCCCLFLYLMHTMSLQAQYLFYLLMLYSMVKFLYLYGCICFLILSNTYAHILNYSCTTATAHILLLIFFYYLLFMLIISLRLINT